MGGEEGGGVGVGAYQLFLLLGWVLFEAGANSRLGAYSDKYGNMVGYKTSFPLIAPLSSLDFH